jgi:hypothetical protein
LALPLFALTLFVSAFLLFLVQPMIGKMILPKLGGTPQVWNTCMMFFQMALLAGYAYTHTVSTRLSLRRQLIVHGILLFVPFVFLLPDGPFNVTEFIPPAGSNPIFATLGLLALAVGVPFFVVATSAPLLQKWFASTGHPAAKDPYFLYGASNLGSLLSLVCYPFMVEPFIPLRAQAYVWTVVYVTLGALILACAALVWKESPGLKLAGGPELDLPPMGEIPQPPPTLATPPTQPTTAVKAGPAPSSARTGIARKKGLKHPVKTAPAPSVAAPKIDFSRPSTAVVDWKRRLRWVLLAFCPVSLMLGVTSYVSVDLSPFPLLWVIPLALYLLSFILVFSKWPVPWVGTPHDVMVFIGVPAIIVLFFIIVKGGFDPFKATMFSFAGFFFATMVCHGELAKDRPTTDHLTEYYLLMAVGGALGGVFNAMIAPQIFVGVAEYPIAIAAACFLRPTLKKDGWFDELVLKTPWAILALVVASALFAVALLGLPDRFVLILLVALGIGVIALAVVSASQEGPHYGFSKWVREAGDNLAKSFGSPAPNSHWVLNYGLDFLLALFVFLLTIWIKNSARASWGWYLNQGNGLVSMLKFFGLSDKQAGEFYANALQIGLYGPAMIFCMMFGFGRAFRFGLSMCALMLVALVMTGDTRDLVYGARSYFGVLRVLEDTEHLYRRDEDGLKPVDPDIKLKDDKGKDVLSTTYTYLMHGTTYHGRNYHEPAALRRVLTTYYHQKGPVGKIMDRYRWFQGPHGTFYADARLPVSMIGMGALPTGVGNLPLDQITNVWSEAPYATIGLGSGTMAGYGRWLQHVTYYEIDDNIRNFSLPPMIKNDKGEETPNPKFLWRGKDPFFTYLSDTIGRGANLEVIMGDARLSMKKEDPQVSALYTIPQIKGNFYSKVPITDPLFSKRENYYKVIVVDAFSSDAIPIHLITKEAIELYFSKLAPDGVLCVHTSNRHMNLVAPVSDIAKALGKKAIVGHDTGRSRRDLAPFLGHFGSEYVMLANDEKYLPTEQTINLGQEAVQEWSIPVPPGNSLWTDDFSNIVSILR